MNPPVYCRAALKVWFLASVVAMFPVSIEAQKIITPGYQFNSDPTCREINGQFYLFTTHDPFTVLFEKGNAFYKGMYDIHAYSTTDFDHWVDHGSLLNTHDAGWHKGNAVWDGDAGIPANGKFYAYIPFRMNPDSEENFGHFQIGVFVTDQVEGPYSDALRKPLTTVDGKEIIGLSPAVVYGDDGAAYLIWGGDAGVDVSHTVSLAKLRPNMIELAEPARSIVVEEHNKDGGIEYFESPILFKNKDTWYLTYVAFSRRNGKPNSNFAQSDPEGCYIQYCTSKSMFGPFNKEPKHFIYPTSGGDLNNHQGVCQYQGKWYVAYHTSYENVHRQVCVTTMDFNADGSLVPIYPDKDKGAGTPGVTVLTLDAFANKREAEEFSARLNADDEKGILGDYHFKLKDGGYLKFNQMDFGPGAAGFRVEVSSENAGLREARLEFRIDSPWGKKIGEAVVSYTKGKDNYVVLTAPVGGAEGIHDVYLVARGSGGDRRGHLFNVNWFTFSRTYRADAKALFAVNCGGPGEDGLSADQPYLPGGWGYRGDTASVMNDATVYYNASLPNAMKTSRQAATDGGVFDYLFSVANGEYTVQLFFADAGETAASVRKFDVGINGKSVLVDFNVLAAAGGVNRAVMEEVRSVRVDQGTIDIGFVSKRGRGKVSAIKIFPGADAVLPQGAPGRTTSSQPSNGR